jgi:hypothetical protein
MIDQIVYVLYAAASWGWWLPSVLLFLLFVWLLSRLPRKAQLLNFVAGLAALAVFSQSARLPGAVIAALGRPGSATLIGLKSPSADQYDIVIQGQDGSVHPVLFDFHHNDTNWDPLSPYTMLAFEVGDRFNVRYLGAAPEHFVIILHDNSPWAHRVGCINLATTIRDENDAYQHDIASSAPASTTAADKSIYDRDQHLYQSCKGKSTDGGT